MSSRPGRVLPRLDEEERARALADPGPTWRQWFLYSFVKAWGLLAFFIGDVFILAAFGAPFLPWALFPSLAVALYGEYLLYQYLWHRPSVEELLAQRRGFKRTWHRPVPYGRWTIEAERARAGQPVLAPDEEPHPDPNALL